MGGPIRLIASKKSSGQCLHHRPPLKSRPFVHDGISGGNVLRQHLSINCKTTKIMNKNEKSAYFFFIMKVTVLHGFLVLLFCTSAFAKGASGQDLLDRKISLTFNQADLKTALKEISILSGVKFSYSRRIFSVKDKITLKVRDESLKTLLPLMLKP